MRTISKTRNTIYLCKTCTHGSRPRFSRRLTQAPRCPRAMPTTALLPHDYTASKTPFMINNRPSRPARVPRPVREPGQQTTMTPLADRGAMPSIVRDLPVPLAMRCARSESPAAAGRCIQPGRSGHSVLGLPVGFCGRRPCEIVRAEVCFGFMRCDCAVARVRGRLWGMQRDAEVEP
jgi:hypothetical protein